MERKRVGTVPLWSMVVSRVFDPVFEIPLALGGAVWFSLAHSLRWRFLVVLLYIDGFLPFVFFLHLLQKGEISSWDIRDRKERIPLYLFTIIAHFVGVWLAWIMGKMGLVVILASFYVVAVVFALVTSFWKISLHAGVNSLLITFLNIVFEWKYWWLYAIVVLVGLARVRGGFHKPMQVVVGALLAGVLFVLSYNLFSLWLL